MTQRDKLTPSELGSKLAFYQIITTLITFFAGFVFVTIPLVIFSVEISPLYGRLLLYWLLAALLIFTVTMDLYHLAFGIITSRTMPHVGQIIGKYPGPSTLIRYSDRLFGIAMFFALSSISFMLLLKGQEFMIEAFIWFLISILRPALGHYLQHRPPRRFTESQT